MAFNGIITTDSSMQIKLVSAYNDQVGYTLTIADFIARVKQIYHYETISIIKFDQAFGGNNGYRAQVVFNTCETLRIINDTSLMNGYSESGNMYFRTENTDILDYANYNYFVSTSTHNDIQYSAQGYFASSPSFTLPDGLSYRATGGGGNPTTIIYYDPACFTSVYINGVLPSAYEYIDNLQDLTGSPGSATYQNITWDKILEYLNNSTSWQRYNVTGDQMVDGVWNKFFNGISDASEHTINTSWGVTIKYNPNNNPGCIVSWTENGNTYSQGIQGGDNSKYGIRFAINDTTQEAVFLVLRAEYSNIFHTPDNTAVYNGSYNESQNNRQSLYRMLMGGIPPVYTWSSISAISGKNGTLNLTEILNINDGDPVNNVPYTDNLDFTAVSKVNNMVAAVVQDSNAVIVEYTVPEDTYEYIKLVYKKDRIPEFVSDGTAVNIPQGSGEKAILGIADGGTYWFVIFTDKSTSEPVEFRTSATGWDGSEVILMWSGENNKLTAQVSEGHILFKMYSGSNVVYSFTAESGATVADSYNMYVQFLEDENQQIAKPSFVYYGDSTGYSINQEIPTNEEMADIYSWLHPSS